MMSWAAELPDLAQKPELLVVVQVGDEEDVLRPADDPEPPEGRLDGRLLQGRELVRQKIAEVRVPVPHPQEGVEVGPAEVGVDEKDFALEGGQVEAEAARNEAFPRPAFSSADSPDPCLHVLSVRATLAHSSPHFKLTSRAHFF